MILFIVFGIVSQLFSVVNLCQTDAVGVDCGFWGHENAPSCSHCGTGPKECGGECFWKENAQACIPLTMSHVPEAYTVSSDGIAGQRYPWLMGTYVLSQYVDECPMEPTYLLYINQDDPSNLMKGNADGWVIGSDWIRWLWYLRAPPTTDSNLFAPKENWGFKYTSKTEFRAFMNDSSISVLPSNSISVLPSNQSYYYMQNGWRVAFLTGMALAGCALSVWMVVLFYKLKKKVTSIPPIKNLPFNNSV